ncbi:MAG: hypothetical protein ACTSRI_00560 [Promethearchaeota archaeon]
MSKLKSQIQLLALLSLFFIYKIIMGFLSSDTNEIILWVMITFVYLISLLILFFVVKNWQKRLGNDSKIN